MNRVYAKLNMKLTILVLWRVVDDFLGVLDEFPTEFFRQLVCFSFGGVAAIDMILERRRSGSATSGDFSINRFQVPVDNVVVHQVGILSSPIPR